MREEMSLSKEVLFPLLLCKSNVFSEHRVVPLPWAHSKPLCQALGWVHVTCSLVSQSVLSFCRWHCERG
jgi:hypothetical protein